jgi:TM2 domain-containing membrane protein YozV
MKKQSIIAGMLSLIIPGLGQMYKGWSSKGGCILAAAITFGNLNIIILPLISLANPVIPPLSNDMRGLWAYWIPRICHDIFSLWCVAFWIWAVVDSYVIQHKANANPKGN